MDAPMAKRHYSDEEKRQLMANLDIEVAHRSRQLSDMLKDRLDAFNDHQEAQISRIPKQVRNMTMREFGEKYDGNIQSALRGYQREKLAAAGMDSTTEVDKSERKRKWVASQESELEGSGSSQSLENARTHKTARTQLESPKKAGSSTGPGTVQGSRIAQGAPRTPATTRFLGRIAESPSPQKLRAPLNNTTSTYNPRPPSRPASPLKRQPSKSNLGSTHTNRVPSSSKFDPALPPKTPAYPGKANTVRLPRKDENMLSINGSPLANPYEFGLGWFKGIDQQLEEDGADLQDGSTLQNKGKLAAGGRTLKRSKSSIVIRRDPSVVFPAGASNGQHSRTESQASFYTASSSHSREGSQASSQPPPVANLGAFRFPPSSTVNVNDSTPKPVVKHTRSFSALVAIPTKNGQVLEFDPLQTSPGAIDALEGISDSAKKQAKHEMGRLIQATVDKWKIG